MSLSVFHRSRTDLRVRSLDDNKGHLWQASHVVGGIKDNVSQAMVSLVSEHCDCLEGPRDFEEKEIDLMSRGQKWSTEMMNVIWTTKVGDHPENKRAWDAPASAKDIVTELVAAQESGGLMVRRCRPLLMVWGRGRVNSEVVSITKAQEIAAKAPTEMARWYVKVAPLYKESGGENLLRSLKILKTGYSRPRRRMGESNKRSHPTEAIRLRIKIACEGSRSGPSKGNQSGAAASRTKSQLLPYIPSFNLVSWVLSHLSHFFTWDTKPWK
ncbi:hypothetical protein EDB89DRAFT_1906332 [Lactarius sanguifluus]|nr:hypothetical protein EDB89DRAFT_1906332 [Lactarius sanguifluus]